MVANVVRDLLGRAVGDGLEVGGDPDAIRVVFEDPVADEDDCVSRAQAIGLAVHIERADNADGRRPRLQAEPLET